MYTLPGFNSPAWGRKAIAMLVTFATMYVGKLAVTEEKQLISAGKESTYKQMTIPVEFTGDTTALKEFTGNYETEDEESYEFYITDGKLVGKPKNGYAVELKALGNNRFIIKEVGIEMLFEKDSKGKVVSVLFFQNGETERAWKIK